MTHPDLPKFESPPVNEVAMGVKFEPIEGLTLAHFGLFWATLRDEFGKSEEAIPLGTPADIPMRAGGGPLPRLWLVHNDEQFLIQLQPNIFYFNWRRRGEKQAYPSYDSIRPLFEKYLSSFFAFLEHEGLPTPSAFSCDLTYVNIIPTLAEKMEKIELGYLFPDFSWNSTEERALTHPKAVNWHSAFDLADEAGDLTAKIQSATNKEDGSSVIKFEINASGGTKLLSLSETDTWFEIAHSAIVMAFADLTISDAQRELWGRKNGAA